MLLEPWSKNLRERYSLPDDANLWTKEQGDAFVKAHAKAVRSERMQAAAAREHERINY